jgi:hypothetical protein
MSNGPLLLSHCTFTDCAAGAGGAIFSYTSSPTIANCLFSGCRSETTGGAVHLAAGNAAITNCTIADCTAAVSGGGIYSHSSNLTLMNSILWRNTAPQGAAVTLLAASDLYVNHTLLHGGWTTISQGDDCRQTWGRYVFRGEPEFVVGPAGCFYLSQVSAGQSANSVCVGTGSNSDAPAALTTMTTSSDEGVDAEPVDLGFHYPVTNNPLMMGDFNRDRSLDLIDFAALQACVSSGPLGDLSPCCRIFDIEPDDDVDLADFALIQPVLTGAQR